MRRRNRHASAAERQLRAVRRRLAIASPRTFAATYLGHHLTLPPCPMHEEMLSLLAGASRDRGARIAIAAPRGYAKTTIVSLAYILWSICAGQERFIVLGSDTAEQATTILADLKKELEHNRLLREDFPEHCETPGRKPRPPRWTRHEIITRSEVKVTALGDTQKVRGRKFRQHRPSLIVLDDVENDEMVMSEDRREALRRWFRGALLKMGDHRTNVIVVGTILHYDSLLAELTDPKRSPAWQSRIYRAVVEWSKDQEKWGRWEEIFAGRAEHGGATGPEAARAYLDVNRGAMLAGTRVLWPQRESYEELMKMRLTEGSSSFNCEKQNEPVDRLTAFFLLEDFTFWTDRYRGRHELRSAQRHDEQIVLGVDPCVGKHIDRGDYSAIVAVMVNTATFDRFIIEADIKRRKPDETVDRVCYLARHLEADVIAIEANGFQDIIATELRNRLQDIRIVPVTHSRNKLQRIQQLQPLVKSGRLQFSREHELLIKQLRDFPRGAHDDGPDALQMAVEVPVPRVPSVTVYRD